MQLAPQFEHFARSERDGTLNRRKADRRYPSAVQPEEKPEGGAGALDHPRGRCFRILLVSWARVIFDRERSNPFWTSESTLDMHILKFRLTIHSLSTG